MTLPLQYSCFQLINSPTVISHNVKGVKLKRKHQCGVWRKQFTCYFCLQSEIVECQRQSQRVDNENTLHKPWSVLS